VATSHGIAAATRRLLLAAAWAWATVPAQAQLVQGAAPNIVQITPLLFTSGQPNAGALAGLGTQGFEAVVYLAPPTVGDAVKDEAMIVGRQGMVFVNIPMDWENPKEKDFQMFSAALTGLDQRKVLVHCQVNMRGSTMTFLYRTITLHEDPAQAYDAVAKVWSPRGKWKDYIRDMLRKHNIAFEPY
jgi:protein tyrosine phosphatase (PTP) superfamily phosphohydrolase (DUF442 family)